MGNMTDEDVFAYLCRTFLLQNITMFVLNRQKKRLCLRKDLQFGGIRSGHVPKLLRYGIRDQEKSNGLAVACVPLLVFVPMMYAYGVECRDFFQ